MRIDLPRIKTSLQLEDDIESLKLELERIHRHLEGILDSLEAIRRYEGILDSLESTLRLGEDDRSDGQGDSHED